MRRLVTPLLIVLSVACGQSQRPDVQGYTPLMRAARDGEISAIARLVAAGHDINYQGRRVTTYSVLFPFTNVETVDVPTRSWTPLIAAAAANQADSIRELLRLGADRDRPGNDGPPIVIAAQRGHLAATSALLESGADPSASFGGTSALVLALKDGHDDVVRILLDRGAQGYAYDVEDALLVRLSRGDRDIIREVYARPRLRSPRTVGREGRQIMLAAVASGRDEATRIPIDAVQDLSRVVGESRELEIVAAIASDDGAAVRRLGAQLLADPHYAAALLGMAAAAGSQNVVEQLLRAGVTVDARDRLQRTALMLARRAPSLAGVKALLAAGADVNATGDNLARTPLMQAASAGNVPLIELLIAHGARVNERDRKRWSAVRIAHEEGRSAPAVEALVAAGGNRLDLREGELVAAFEKDDLQAVEALLRSGGNPSTSTPGGASLLSAAIRNRKDAMAMILIRGRADPDFGGTDTAPLLMASIMGREDIVAALLEAAADPNLVGQFGDRPLTSAVRHPRIVRMLIRGGADVNQRPAKQQTALGLVTRLMRESSPDADVYRQTARILRAAGATEDGRRAHPLTESAARGDVAAFDRALATAGDEDKRRALVAAATTGQSDLARRLLDLGVSPDARVADWTAADAALDANDGAMRDLLLKRGATVTTADRETLGRQLIDAARRGDLAAVNMLIGAGADLNFRGSQQYAKPPLFVAVEHDHAEIVALLIRAGADVNRGEKFFYTHQTPLMAAALEGSVDAARVLIDAGANVHYADERQTTALSIAEGQRQVNYLGREPAFTRIAALLRTAGAR